MSGPDWRVLDLPSALSVEHIANVGPGVVSLGGLHNGLGYAAKVRPDGDLSEISIPPESAAQGPARIVRISDFGVLGVCGATALWGNTWHPYVSHSSEQGHDEQLRSLDVPEDENGTAAAWLWATAGDDNLQATAAYPTAGGHEIRPLETDSNQLMPIERRLVTAAPLSDIHVAAFAGRVTAAGPITDPDTLTVWWARSYIPDSDDYRPRAVASQRSRGTTAGNHR